MKRLKKYGVGGLLSGIGGLADAYSNQSDGSTDPASSFISGATNGASVGSLLGPVGGVVGGIVGGVKGMMGAESANRELLKRKKKMRLFEEEMQSNNDKAYLQTYPTNGVASSGFYAKGGNLVDPPGTDSNMARLIKPVARESTAINLPIEDLQSTLKQQPLWKYEDHPYLPKEAIDTYNKSRTTQNKRIVDSGYENRFIARNSEGFLSYAAGGELTPITGKVDQVVGDTHSQDTNMDGQTGVMLPTPQGGQAEVEGGEVMKDGRYVFSNRLGMGGRSYANLAKEIAITPEYQKQEQMKSKAEKRMGKNLGGVYDTSSKRLLARKDALDILFDKQEDSKAAESNQQYAALGADLGTLSDKFKGRLLDIAPYADNIANSIINKQTPEIPLPRLTNAPRLQTEFRVDDQLSAIDRAGSARDRNIRQTSGNAATTRANLLAGSSQDIQTTNQVLGEKQRQELSLQNAQIGATYQNTVNNNALMSNYDTNQMYRTDDMQQRVSQNVADASTNAMQQGRDRMLDVRDNQALALTAMKYLESGVLDRSGYSKVMKALSEGKGLDEALALLEQAKTAVSQSGALNTGSLSLKKSPKGRLWNTNNIYDNIYGGIQPGDV